MPRVATPRPALTSRPSEGCDSSRRISGSASAGSPRARRSAPIVASVPSDQADRIEGSTRLIARRDPTPPRSRRRRPSSWRRARPRSSGGNARRSSDPTNRRSRRTCCRRRRRCGSPADSTKAVFRRPNQARTGPFTRGSALRAGEPRRSRRLAGARRPYSSSSGAASSPASSATASSPVAHRLLHRRRRTGAPSSDTSSSARRATNELRRSGGA